jgi:hypothetical protein
LFRPMAATITTGVEGFCIGIDYGTKRINCPFPLGNLSSII